MARSRDRGTPSLLSSPGSALAEDRSDPRVSVLLLTLNPGPRFAEIIGSILNQDLSPIEILAVDSGSSDGTVELLERAGVPVEVIAQANFGHGRTRNMMAAKARGDLLAFLTHDALPVGRDWLRQLAGPFEDPSVVGTYGRQVAPPGATLVEIHLLNYIYPNHGRLVRLAANERFQMPTHFFSNANSMIRRDVWRHTPFSEAVIMCEDQWWAKEVLRKGYVIAYSPSAVVLHSHHLRARDTFRRSFDTGVAMRDCDETPATAVAMGFLRYISSLTWYVIRQGSWSQLAPAWTQAMSRAMGYAIGSRHRLLPLKLRRRLSLHKYYWK